MAHEHGDDGPLEFHSGGGALFNKSTTGKSEPPAAKVIELPMGQFSGQFGSCYETHKPLVVTKSGGMIYGGSCLTPIVKDADVYIGFDRGMRPRLWTLPWHPSDDIGYPVDDMSVPKNPKAYIALVSWALEQIDAGRKVHAGCIGGHGRTGMFLAALVRVGLGIEDATLHTRQHYCKKAVESYGQSKWLNEHFGIKLEPGYKDHHTPLQKTWGAGSTSGSSKKPKKQAGFAMGDAAGALGGKYSCMKHSPLSIWAQPA